MRLSHLFQGVVCDHNHAVSVGDPHVAQVLILTQHTGMIPLNLSGVHHSGVLQQFVGRNALQRDLQIR